ncbi:hypothetical protein RCL1_000995 [Eukaryota sp. TZLM3-RCL]
MHVRLVNLTLYILSVIAFVGLVFTIQVFIFNNVLAEELFRATRLWQTGLPTALLLSYHYYALPHVFLSHLTFRLAAYLTDFSFWALFTLSVNQTLVALLFVYIAVTFLHLNMRSPSLRDIVIHYMFVFSLIFVSFWTSYLIRLVFGEFVPEPFSSLAETVSGGAFSYALLIPFFLSIVVPLIDHLLVYHFGVLKDEINRWSNYKPHFCWNCQPPKQLVLLTVFFIVSICLIVFLFWLSTFGIAWYVITGFIAFLFIGHGYYWSCYFGLAFFYATVLAVSIFDIVPGEPLNVTLFVVVVTLLTLFSAKLSDEIKDEKQRSEQELQALVDQRTHSLQDSQHKLSESLNSKRVFIQQISHELITPIHQASSSLATLSTLSLDSKQLKALASTRLAHFFLSRQVDDLLVSAALDRASSFPQNETTFYSLFDDAASDFKDIKVYVNILEVPCPHKLVHVNLELPLYSKTLELIIRHFLASMETNLNIDSVVFLQVVTSVAKLETFRVLDPTEKLQVHYTFRFEAYANIFYEEMTQNLTITRAPEPSRLLVHLTEVTSSQLRIANEAIQWDGFCNFSFLQDFLELVPKLKERFSSFSVYSSNDRLHEYVKCLLEQYLVYNVTPTEVERHLYIIDRIHFRTDVEDAAFPSNQRVNISKKMRMNTVSLPVTPLKLARCLNNVISGLSHYQVPLYAEVLVVDDSKMNVTLLQGMLKKLDVLSDAAFDGEQAIEVFGERLRDDSKDSYKLVIMDILMPKLDGIEATKAIRNLEQSTSHENTMASVIVALSAHALNDDKSVREMNTVGFDLMIKKPISLERLKQCLYEAGVFYK